jgi:hypothetical protein
MANYRPSLAELAQESPVNIYRAARITDRSLPTPASIRLDVPNVQYVRIQKRQCV